MRAPTRRRTEGSAGPVARSTHDEVLALQRSAGNSAVASRLAATTETPAPAGSATLFRKGFFSKMWQKFKGVFVKPKVAGPVESATTDGPTTAPQELTEGTGPEQSTETPVSEDAPGQSTDGTGPGKEAETTPASSGPIAPETTKTEPEHPSPPPLAMDLASGEAVLKNAFGSLKTIVPGSIQILDPPAFKEAYDKIYGAGQYSWDRYVVPTYGSLNGFAHGGVNYINTGSAGLHTVVHEMLHNNCANDFIPVVGSRFNEGATEILTQVACKKLNVDAPICYPGESPCVQALLDAGLSLDDLEAAYLNGGAKEKIADWVDANCKENWATVMGHMEAKDWAAAKAGMAKK